MQFLDDDKVNQHTGFLDPMRICKTMFTVSIDPKSEAYKGKSEYELDVIKNKMVRNKQIEMAGYIGSAMHRFVELDKDDIVAPYHFE